MCSDTKNKSKDNIALLTLITLLTGIIGVFAATHLSTVTQTAPGSAFYTLASGLTTLSVALVGFAVFSLAIDTKNWRDYFAERIKEIVLDNNYLNQLDADTLRALQTNALKAQFKNPKIDKEGGFLDYFHNNLHKYISEPYREDVSAEVLMSNSATRPDCFEVTDKITYVCRTSSNRIQPSINWSPDADEFEEIQSMEISIQYPEYHSKRGTRTKIKDSTDKTELMCGFTVSLDDYINIDGLVVIVESKYLVQKGKFQYWQMAHPSRNFDITITYPRDDEIQLKPLVMEDVVSQVTRQEGYLKFKYDSWLLPESGIAWLITPSKCVASSSNCFNHHQGSHQE